MQRTQNTKMVGHEVCLHIFFVHRKKRRKILWTLLWLTRDWIVRFRFLPRKEIFFFFTKFEHFLMRFCSPYMVHTNNLWGQSGRLLKLATRFYIRLRCQTCLEDFDFDTPYYFLVWYLCTESSLTLLSQSLERAVHLKGLSTLCQPKLIFSILAEYLIEGFDWVGSLCIQFGFTAAATYSEMKSVFIIHLRASISSNSLQKTIPMSMFRRKFLSATLKCEKGNNLKPQHIYSLVLWKMKKAIFYVSNTEAVRILQIFSQVFWRIYEAYVTHKRQTKFGIIS